MLNHFSLFSRCLPFMRNHFHVSSQKIARRSVNCREAFFHQLFRLTQHTLFLLKRRFVEFPYVCCQAIFDVMASSLQISLVGFISSKVVLKSDARVHRDLAVNRTSEPSVVQCDIRISSSSIGQVVDGPGDISDGSWLWGDIRSIFQLRQVPGRLEHLLRLLYV